MRIFALGQFLAALIMIGATGSALADDDSLRPLCPDRPGKGTSPCTVDATYWQVEVDAFDATLEHHAGATQDNYVVLAPLIKYGVTDSLDVEAGLAPFNWSYSKSGASSRTESGFGDLFLRTKWNFLGAAAGPLTSIIEPFLKVPTASHDFGDGAVEGGILVPLAYDLGNNWSLASTPEVDFLKNALGGGRHANLVNVIAVGKGFDDGITLGAEIWADQNEDSKNNATQSSFDVDIAWQPKSDGNLQIDGGIDFGLNSRTPGLEIYTGITRRF